MSKQNDATTKVPSSRTVEELALLSDLAKLQGRELTEQEANLAIDQYRAMGLID